MNCLYAIRPESLVRLSRVLLVASLALFVGAPAGRGQTALDEVGYTLLKNRLGPALPLGEGGEISQVEAKNSLGAFFVDGASSQFTATSDPNGVAVSLTNGSPGAGSGVSGHATHTVGAPFYGNTLSMAPGANSVTVYEVNHWLNNIIKYNSNAEPVAQPFRVQNHSWIGSIGAGMTAQDREVLRRFDYLIETGEMTAVVGTNNLNPLNPSTFTHPNLMVHSYNAIVVGRSDGYHARGTTSSLYGPGRFRPDIVVPRPSATGTPGPTTSRATATVSSAAALLRDVLDGADGARSETIKAILLAGATKNEFTAFEDPETGGVYPWDRTPTRPLDELLGAGELNIYNSYLIQLGGQHAGAQTEAVGAAGSYGWDYQNHKGDAGVGDIFYDFVIPEGSTAKELSIILAWNVNVSDMDASPFVFTPQESLKNLDLRLYTESESLLGEPGDPLRTSVSTVDNVEHIYAKDLEAGTYTLKVSGAADWDFGLAWRMATQFDEVSADFNEDGVVDGADFIAWQQNLGTLINATHAQGDADGDGDVDGDDLEAWKLGLMPAPPVQIARAAATVASVPEPSSLAMFALLLTLLGMYLVTRRETLSRRCVAVAPARR